jgi:hypothetical protein
VAKWIINTVNVANSQIIINVKMQRVLILIMEDFALQMTTKLVTLTVVIYVIILMISEAVL